MKARLFAVAHFTVALLSAIALTLVMSVALSVMQPVFAAPGGHGANALIEQAATAE